MRKLGLGTVLFSMLTGCSSADLQVAPDPDSSGDVSGDLGVDGAGKDSTTTDTMPADATTDSKADSTATDTGTTTDSGTTTDTSTADTGTSDTGTSDTGTSDTGTSDTGTADTGTSDTGTSDTGTADTGTSDTGLSDTGTTDTGTDTGPLCPRPPSTATFDASSYGCDALKAKYPGYLVPGAKRCLCDADCNTTIAKDFCGCTVNVSTANDEYKALVAMQAKWKDLGCFTICPAILCPEPPTPKCIIDATSGTGQCK